MERDEESAVLVRMDFYDIYSEKIKTLYSDELTFDFIYPENTSKYSISIINEKHQELKFYYLLIAEKSSNLDYCEINKYKTNLLEINNTHKSEETLELEIGVNCLREATSFLPQVQVNEKRQSIQLLLTRQFKDDEYIKLLQELASLLNKKIKSLPKLEKVYILKGLDFERLPRKWQGLPNILASLSPEVEFVTDFPFLEEAEKEQMPDIMTAVNLLQTSQEDWLEEVDEEI